jgi:hypothetical protein
MTAITHHDESRMPERVRAGAEMLDEIRPGWHNEVDFEILDMRNSCHCIVGQLYQHPDGRVCKTPWTTDRYDPEYGFDLCVDVFEPEPWDAFQVLQGLWIEEIIARRHLENMDIGEEKRTIRVEPIRKPIPAETPEPVRRTVPRKEPATTPERKPAPVKTPAKGEG